MSSNSFRALSDDQLLLEVKRLAHCERRATAALIRALVEFDTRKLFLREGCSSLFTYCTQELHLSEAAAYNRIEAARAARHFPAMLDALEQGQLSLTAARLLAPHLTEDNHARVLAAAVHKSKRHVEELVAALNPQPQAPPVIRRVPSTQPPSEPSPVVAHIEAEHDVPETAAPTSRPMLSAVQNVTRQTPLATAAVKPVAPELYRLHVTLPAATYEKLGRAQRILRHAVPSGDPAEILDRALTLLVAHLERRRFAEVRSPRSSSTASGSSRHVPADVRRTVWRRDEGRCAFVGRSGRCQETAFLEFHHVEPYAAGGAATVENIQLRCRAHNQYEARLFLGDMEVREDRLAWGGAAVVQRCVTEIAGAS